LHGYLALNPEKSKKSSKFHIFASIVPNFASFAVKQKSHEKKITPKDPRIPPQLQNLALHPRRGSILGDGKWRILKLIEEKGSLKAACEALGYTYRRTWGNLKRIEKILGFPLLEKQRGGIDGGRTYLSPEGKKLVQAFDTFHSRVDMTIQEGFAKLMDDLKDI